MRCANLLLPHARRAGFSCAAACNVGLARSRAFARHTFDLPLLLSVLHDYAGVAALAVQRVAAAHFARVIIAAVDGASLYTGCAGDEEEAVACRGRRRMRSERFRRAPTSDRRRYCCCCSWLQLCGYETDTGRLAGLDVRFA